MPQNVEIIFEPMPQPVRYRTDYELVMGTLRAMAALTPVVLAIAGVMIYFAK